MTDSSIGKAKRWNEGLTGYHYLVLAVAVMGWMFDTMDQWLFVFAKQPAMRTLLPGVPENELNWYIGVATMCMMLGWATGGLFFGMVGDKLGRTKTMAITILMYAGFTGLSGLSQNWIQFVILRFLTGLGIGGEFAAGAALVAETFPDHARPTALAIVQSMSAIGNVLSGVINLTLSSVVTSLDEVWRYVFFIGIIPALLVFVIRLYVKEPESWSTAREKANKGEEGLGSINELFSDPRWRKHTIIGVILATVGVIGFWGISVWSAELLRKILNPENLPELKRATEIKVSLAVMAQNFGCFLGALAYGVIAKSVGRKIGFALALIGCLIVIPITFLITNSFPVAVIMFFSMGFMLLAIFSGYAVYFPELYPTRLRATGVGFCYNVARYISAFAPYIFGNLATRFGLRHAGVMISAVFVIGLAILPFAPETKGKPLPE
ncbi:MAG: MFS transporter [Candidatus Hydrogenedentes bacterium]|nr:MFS transporter [Candidatus Hydrogenedentota bacterium]